MPVAELSYFGSATGMRTYKITTQVMISEYYRTIIVYNASLLLVYYDTTIHKINTTVCVNILIAIKINEKYRDEQAKA